MQGRVDRAGSVGLASGAHHAQRSNRTELPMTEFEGGAETLRPLFHGDTQGDTDGDTVSPCVIRAAPDTWRRIAELAAYKRQSFPSRL